MPKSEFQSPVEYRPLWTLNHPRFTDTNASINPDKGLPGNGSTSSIESQQFKREEYSIQRMSRNTFISKNAQSHLGEVQQDPTEPPMICADDAESCAAASSMALCGLCHPTASRHTLKRKPGFEDLSRQSAVSGKSMADKISAVPESSTERTGTWVNRMRQQTFTKQVPEEIGSSAAVAHWDVMAQSKAGSTSSQSYKTNGRKRRKPSTGPEFPYQNFDLGIVDKAVEHAWEMMENSDLGF